MTRSRSLRTRALFLGAAFAVVAGTAVTTIVRADSGTITACVNKHSGEMKIVASSATCGSNGTRLEWNQVGPPGPQGKAGAPGAAGPPGAPGAPGTSGPTNVQYIMGGMFPGTSVARAFCPEGATVMGGGGFSSGPGLRYSYPISDATGVNAFGSVAIGWQVAAEDFSDVQAFVVCVGP